MSKFTPGPWSYQFEEDGGYDCITDSFQIRKGHQLITNVDMADYATADGSIAEVNARLISKAPEMYELLKIWNSRIEAFFSKKEKKTIVINYSEIQNRITTIIKEIDAE